MVMVFSWIFVSGFWVFDFNVTLIFLIWVLDHSDLIFCYFIKSIVWYFCWFYILYLLFMCFKNVCFFSLCLDEFNVSSSSWYFKLISVILFSQSLVNHLPTYFSVISSGWYCCGFKIAVVILLVRLSIGLFFLRIWFVEVVYPILESLV